MKKTLKIFLKFLKITAVTIIVLITVAVALGYFYEDDVKAYAVKKIEEAFSADIHVEKIDLSFWRKFPSASLRFKNIAVRDAHIAENPPVFAARNLFMEFDIKDILHRNFDLKKVEVEGGKIDILIYKSGKNNFDLFNDTASDSSGFFLSLRDFRLKDMELSFENQGSVQSYNIYIEDISLPLQITSKSIESGIKGKMKIISYRSEGVEIFKNRNIAVNAGLSYLNNDSKLSFTESEFMINGVRLKMKGFFDFSTKNVTTRLHIFTPELNLKSLIAALPSNISVALKDYNLSGGMKTGIDIAGTLGGKIMPSVKAVFSLDNASLVSSRQGLEFTNLSVSGSFTNGRRRSLSTSLLKLEKINGKINGEYFNGKLTIADFKNSRISANLTSATELEALKKIAGITVVEKMNGRMNININFNARIRNLLDSPQMLNYSIKGSGKLKDAALKLESQSVSYTRINGNFSFDNKNLRLEGFGFTVDGSTIRAKAKITNYIAVAGGNSQPVIIRADIVNDSISFGKLMKIVDFGEDDDSDTKFETEIYFASRSFRWDNMIFENATGTFNYRNNRWDLSNLRFGFVGGKINGNVKWKPIGNNNSTYYITGDYSNIDVKKVFRIFDDFGQTVIRSSNIWGQAGGNFKMTIPIDSENNLITQGLNARVAITITNGRLTGIKELNELSSYTRIDDFSDIRFSTLTNTITIANEKIIIPKMHIVSDKMDIDVFGTHNFDNEYNYHLNVLLADVLGRKIRKTNENEFGIVEEDGYGKTRIFLSITGNSDDFKVSYDKKEAAGKMKEDVKQEGDDIKKVLRQEFINERRDSIRKAKRRAKEKEKRQLKQQEEGKFIIEWDDSDDDDTSSQEPQLP